MSDDSAKSIYRNIEVKSLTNLTVSFFVVGLVLLLLSTFDLLVMRGVTSMGYGWLCVSMILTSLLTLLAIIKKEKDNGVIKLLLASIPMAIPFFLILFQTVYMYKMSKKFSGFYYRKEYQFDEFNTYNQGIFITIVFQCCMLLYYMKLLLSGKEGSFQVLAFIPLFISVATMAVVLIVLLQNLLNARRTDCSASEED